MIFPVDWKVLVLFCLTELAFSASPGPAVFLVVSRALKDGMAAAMATAAGVLAGNLVYFAMSAMAIGAFIFALREWFFVAQWAGALYLFLLAAKILAARQKPQTATGKAAFRESFLVQLANPKTIVFFIAFLPLFINAQNPAAPQIAVLATASFLTELTVLFFYAAAARKAAILLGGKISFLLPRISAFLLCIAALSLFYIEP